MTKPHKWAEIIKAWADGKNIQFKHKKDVDWYDICTDEGADSPNFNIPTLEWRIKPTIKLNVCYRIALWRKYNSTSYHLELVTFTGNCSEASVEWNTISKDHINTFVRWLSDPIHIEIED